MSSITPVAPAAVPARVAGEVRVSSAEGSPYRRHLPALDGVRGIAVLGVMASHLFYANYQHGNVWEQRVGTVLRLGASGVDLFFVLSGFLITGILFDSLGDGKFFRKFYARRTLRIFPLYYAVLAGFVGLALAGRHYGNQLVSLALYLQNTHWVAVPIFEFREQKALPLQHFWSLAVEEQFYLVWPLMVFFLRKRRTVLAACVAGGLVSAGFRWYAMSHGWSYEMSHATTLFRLDTLLAGGALALLLRGEARARVLQMSPWMFWGSVMAMTVCNELRLPAGMGWQALDVTVVGTLYALAGACLIATVLRQGSRAERVFSWGVLRTLGKYSYGLYVLHFIIGSHMEEPLRVMLATHVSPNRIVVITMGGLIEGVISFGAAYLSYHLYEKQFLKLKRFFDYRPHANTAPGTI